MAEVLQEVQSLKEKVHLKEKDVADVVRTSNRLQGLVNKLNDENLGLR